MRIVLTLLFFINMSDYNFEKFIGKEIPEVSNILNCVFENNLINKNFYYTEKPIEESFYYGIKYNVVSLTTDNDSFINSITIHFKEVINSDFYNLFIDDYGIPDSIKVVKSKKTIEIVEQNKNSSKSFNQKLKSSVLNTEEGKFEDKPLYISWKKQNYSIKILMRHEQNISDITFTKAIKE